MIVVLWYVAFQSTRCSGELAVASSVFKWSDSQSRGGGRGGVSLIFHKNVIVSISRYNANETSRLVDDDELVSSYTLRTWHRDGTGSELLTRRLTRPDPTQSVNVLKIPQRRRIPQSTWLYTVPRKGRRQTHGDISVNSWPISTIFIERLDSKFAVKWQSTIQPHRKHVSILGPPTVLPCEILKSEKATDKVHWCCS